MAALRASQGPRGARHRPPRPRPGQVHHQGAARARRAARRRTCPRIPAEFDLRTASTAPASRPSWPPPTAACAATWSRWRAGTGGGGPLPALSRRGTRASCGCASGCARSRSRNRRRNGRRPPPGAHPPDRRAASSRAPASSRPSKRSWCCAASATSPCRCPASRSTPGRTRCPNANGAGPVGDRRAAAGGVRGRLAQARPDRRDRHQQGRRGGDRPGAARRPGRRPGRGRGQACPGQACCAAPAADLAEPEAPAGGAEALGVAAGARDRRVAAVSYTDWLRV